MSEIVRFQYLYYITASKPKTTVFTTPAARGYYQTLKKALKCEVLVGVKY